MTITKWTALPLAALCIGLAACGDKQPTSSEPAATSTPSATPTASEAPSATPDPAQAWIGRWTGPEGTYLQLDAAAPGRYDVRIKDLDAERKFPAEVKDGVLHFERDGKSESLQPTDGDATGMKWLADKKTCLTVKPGEGYCRD